MDKLVRRNTAGFRKRKSLNQGRIDGLGALHSLLGRGGNRSVNSAQRRAIPLVGRVSFPVSSTYKFFPSGPAKAFGTYGSNQIVFGGWEYAHPVPRVDAWPYLGTTDLLYITVRFYFAKGPRGSGLMGPHAKALLACHKLISVFAASAQVPARVPLAQPKKPPEWCGSCSTRWEKLDRDHFNGLPRCIFESDHATVGTKILR